MFCCDARRVSRRPRRSQGSSWRAPRFGECSTRYCQCTTDVALRSDRDHTVSWATHMTTHYVSAQRFRPNPRASIRPMSRGREGMIVERVDAEDGKVYVHIYTDE